MTCDGGDVEEVETPDGGYMEEVETHRLIWTPPSPHLREPANYTPDYSQGFTSICLGMVTLHTADH